MKINHKKLVELRRKLGITQTTMSKDLGIQRANISRYESGSIKSPSAAIIQKIADYLDCNVDDLILAKDEYSQTIPNRVDVHIYFHWGQNND
jgi:transcriptional regulator with XRE-family HTH domain